MPRKPSIFYNPGDQRGRLTVRYLDRSNSRRPRIVADCDCGAEVDCCLYSFHRGDTQSCGCLWTDTVPTHGMSGHPMYAIWDEMRRRCGTHPHYIDVSCDPRWETFQGFLDHPPSGDWFPGAHLCRTADEGDYSPDNCRWDTQQANLAEQHENHSYRMTDGTLAYPIARSNGISNSTFQSRITDYGWTVDRAATEPVRGDMIGEELARDVAKRNGVPHTTYHRRRRNGWTIERAATEQPLKRGRRVTKR